MQPKEPPIRKWKGNTRGEMTRPTAGMEISILFTGNPARWVRIPEGPALTAFTTS